MTDLPAVNANQIAEWNEAMGRTWAEMQDRLDAQLQPLGAAAMDRFAPRPGERLLDVGCGCGQTTLALAEAVGPGGEVIGVDISEPMLATARSRSASPGSGRAVFRLADAQTDRFDRLFDGIFSRFGVMFFEDPVAAFASLRAALKPGGRLAFVCWRPMAENPMFTAPMAAALPHLPPPPPPPPPEPGAPGPFAFADPGRVRDVLEGAGFQEVRIDPLDREISPGGVEDALALTLRIGPLGRMLRENPQAQAAVIDDLRSALAAYAPDGVVRFPSATWLVTATAP